MKVQAEFSLYPLKMEHLGTAIQEFALSLERAGLAVEIGRMSSGAPSRLKGQPVLGRLGRSGQR